MHLLDELDMTAESDLADTHHTPQNNDIHANQAGRDDEEIKAGTVTMVTEQDSSTGTTDVKLLEARSAILLLKNDAYASRHEPTMWILDHMFRPLTTRDYDDYQLLLLSASMKPAWERKKYQPPSQEGHLTALHHPHQITSCSGTTTASTTNEAAPTPPSSSALSMQPTKDNSNKMYIITPRTRILNVSKEHCMVFVIDLSSSLATIETSTGKVMIGSTFTVLENIIQGLVKPFSICTSESSPPIVMEHLIRITVIAECSQFGSNMNVIPILAEYPTMRVLLQNTHVSIHNVTSVLKTLKETIDTFKKDLGKFRKKLTTKRSKMGYELDVREDHAQSVAESVESSFKLQNALDSPTLAAAATKSRKGSLGSNNRSIQPPTRHARNKSISSKQQPKKSDTHHTASHATNKKAANTSTHTHHHHHHHSHHSHHRHSSSSLSTTTLDAGPTRRTNAKDKKDVWGVGKTGSSLSYILRAGSFALSLLPKHGGQSSLILLTDGVVKSNIQDESVIRHLTAQHISCSVVQIGQDKGFFPGLNFGFVPDNEILEFVAQATNGIFSFAEQCPSIMDDVGNNSSSTEDLFFMPPNIYHHRYMLKEVNLDHAHASRLLRKNKESSNSQGKSVDSDASSADNAGSLQSNGMGTMTPAGTVPHFGRRAFPWDPMSIPIAEDLGKLKFKEYFLPTECWHFMRARLRQGFVLQSVSFIDEPKSAAALTKSATNTLRQQQQQQQQQQQHTTVDGLPNFQRKQNVVIVFILRWQPTITVQYSIKALWTSSLRYHLKSMSVTQEKLMNIPEEPPNMMDCDNIFSCMRAPKAEIVIKSTSTFSHMLHNWDQFQRRSQMMAVQGGHTTVDLASAPGFIKVGKMKRLLERLADTDSMLKQLVQFNIIDKGGQHPSISSQHDNNSAVDGSMGSSMEWHSQLNYIQKFSSHWAKLERSELRVFNACWYDEHDFNVIIGDATDCCKTNAMDVDRVQIALNLIYDKLHRWSTFISEQQQVYIKLLNVGTTSRHASVVDTTNHGTKQPSGMYNNTSHSGNRKHVVPQFCEVRVVRETDRVLLIKMMFFNTDIRLRHSMMEELQGLLQSSPMQDSVQTLHIKSPGSNSSSTISHGLGIAEDEYYMDTSTTVTLSKRPLSSLLMRDSSHFLPAGQQAGGLLLDANKPNVQESSNSISSSSSGSSKSSKGLWSVSPSMQLTGEFLVRNYLYQYTWHWDTQDVLNDKHMFHRYFSPIIHLAFDHIMAVRSEQKWNLISFNKSFAHFYKEISFTCEGSYMAHSAQYFIWKDMAKKRISTELWLEPMFDQTLKLYDPIKAEIFDKDKSILSQLITFDVMYLFGKSATATIAHTLSEHPMEVEDETRGVTKWMQKTSLFNMASALKLGQCLFALYPCPNYNRHFHPEGSDSVVIEQQQQQQHQESLVPESFESTASFIRRRNGAFAPSTAPTTATPIGTSRSRTVSRFSPIGSPLTTASRTPLAWHSDKGSTTCTCPRPDELFCTEKDDISKLRPVFRDMALLHYYVEQSLYAVTDRSMSLNKTTTHDDFWPALMKEIFAQENKIGAHASTLLVAQNFRDLQCFIKLFDPSVFIVILMPRLDAIVKGLCKLDHVAGVVSSFERMGLMMFECQRQDKATGNQYDMDHAITVKPIDFNSSKDWLESLRSTLRPSLSRGYLSGTALLHEALSDRTLRLMQDVAQVYSRSFVKSIFTCLLHGRAVDSEDFEKVIEICDESNLDIDLTGYLNVQTLLKRRSRTSEQELISANQRFISVLGHYFEPVIISNTKWSNMYCYRPPFAKVGQKLGLSLSSGEKPSNLADVVVCAQNPLFVRLDCTLRKPAASGVGFEEITFPLKSLPVLYEGETESGMVYNYEPESIGTKFSPVDSADGTTATLHLVCMTLPQSEYDPPNALFSHKLGCPADSAVHHQASFLDAEKTHRARLPSLSQDKQDALVETEARLTWLFTEEIMHGLLRSGPITQNVIRYIEAQLKKKNPFVDFPTTMFIPLAFVKNQRDSRRMFFEQLEKHDKTPYRLVRVGDCFYASDNGSNSFALPSDLLAEQEADKQGRGEMDETMSLFDGEGLNITTDRHKKTSSDSDSGTVHGKEEDEEQQSDEFCHGLGISILEPETPDEDDSHTVKPEPVRPQLYWLLLIPQAQNVQIYFYSKMQQAVNRSEIIRVTKSMVNEVMERTNKMSLLQYLHETRRCSKYLLASAEQEKSMYSSCEESSDEDDYAGTTALTTTATTTTAGNNLVEILSTSGEETTLAPPKKFLPGQFSCDLVFTKRFPLHWRLAPNAAYNKLMTDTLPPFLVQNKPGMFVCSHQDAVVYCFLSEVTTTVHSAALSDSMNQSFLSATNADDSNSYYMANPESPYGGGVSLTTAMTNESDVASNATRARYPSHVYNSRPSPQGSMTSDRQQFSPRQSPSLTDAGASASSPIAGRKPGTTRHYEGRELLLEVYGVEMDYYIVDGLVEMINSRITSEITLKEVQQFLVRNPNSKLSRADMDFILPVEKEPLVHRQLSVPCLIENTVHFLKILRKNILTGSSLHVLHSNYLPAVLKKQHDLRYASYDFSSRVLDESGPRSCSATTDEWSCLDFAFYYNYLNRAPGTYLPLEQKIGEGVAGICLSVLDSQDIAYRRIISEQPGVLNADLGDLDTSPSRSCLSSNFEDASDGGEKVKISIDIWSHCKINVDQIYKYIYDSFRQSICDYIIENTVLYLPLVKYDDAEFKSLSTLLLFALKKAAEWESSTIKRSVQSIKIAPWYLDGITMQLKSDLLDVHPSLDPIVARAVMTSTLPNEEDPIENFKLYNPSLDGPRARKDSKGSLVAQLSIKTGKNALWNNKGQQQDRKLVEIPTFDNTNYRYLVISGLPEQSSHQSTSFRRSSAEIGTTEPNHRLHARGIYFGSMGTINAIGEDDLLHLHKTDSFSSSRRDDNASLHSRQESLASSITKALPSSSSNVHSKQQPKIGEQLNKDYPHQHSFIVFTMDSDALCIYAYNCSDRFVEHMYNVTVKNVLQQETRHMGLNNILHQKLGLFHHSDTMVNILSRNLQEPASPFDMTAPPALVPATPLLQHNAITQVQQIAAANSSTGRSSPSLANTIGRLVQMDSSSSIPSIDSLGNSSSERKSSGKAAASTTPAAPVAVADFESLQHLVTNNYEYKNRTSRIMSAARLGPTDKLPMQHSASVLDIYDNTKLCKSSIVSGGNGGTSSADPAAGAVFTAVRGADANTVLRDVYADSTEDNRNWYDKDYLLRHGEPYLEMYLARSKPLAAHEKAFKVYTKWADQYYGPGHTKTIDEMMTVDELKQILKASRLLHFCRTPLIFSGTNSPNLLELSNNYIAISGVANGGGAVAGTLGTTAGGYESLFNKLTVSKSEEMTAWYERLSRGFMREYASYLESIGMHLIVYGPSNDQQDEMEAYLSSFTITEDYAVNSPVVYLLQVFEGGSIMCEVRLTGAFVSVTLYTLHRRYGRLQFSPYSRQRKRKEIGRENFQKFMTECDQFKQRIHVNSFVFDFHLRYIQRSLDDVELLPPNLNLLSIIKNTVSVYDRPAIYARNRIINGLYEVAVDDSLGGLTAWFMNTGSKLGLKTLKVDGVPVACFVSSDDLSFESHRNADEDYSNEDAPFRYTLIMCPAEKSSTGRWRDSISVHRQGSFDMMGSSSVHKIINRVAVLNDQTNMGDADLAPKIHLQYFILVTYRGMDRCTSSDRCQRAWSKVLKDKPKRHANFLNEVLSPETFTLNDVFESAKKKMDHIVNKAVHFFHREADWNTLYEIVRPNLSKELPQDLVRLALKFNPIQLGDMDPAFNKFLALKGVNWNDVLDNLKLFYMMTCGDIQIKDTRHVLLFIPNTTFFHFVYTPGEQCQVSINSKEDRSTPATALTDDEKHHVSNLATSLSYYLWKRIR
ncbi:hypothetical protein MAM1_0004d00434 [Mucor ambiguus]|uniref:Uncharacterized protein n=1 Tax=Mucor ambiguus TaxID=91626 RepID=A0A0C9LPS4_9FUNG|nr:hypothetical protein MAM1_0004d00434 [Mucor ambiguus]